MSVCSSHRNVLVGRRASSSGFTLVEVLVSLVILAIVLGGVCYGYTEANRIAIWSSMSQAAQSFALQGMEQARDALWNPWDANTVRRRIASHERRRFHSTRFHGCSHERAPYASTATNYAYFQTNYVYITKITNSNSGMFYCQLRQITSTVVWTFPFTRENWTNTVVTLRASDQ